MLTSRLTTAPRALRSVAAVAALLLAALGPAAAAQTFVYSFADDGKVSVNGLPIDNLKGGFELDDLDIQDVGDEDLEAAWTGFDVEGADWYALRFDGRVEQSGIKVADLAETSDDFWVDLVVLDGEFWALRTDGRLSRDGEAVQDIDTGQHYARALAKDAGTVWVLRSDGRVFRALQSSAVFEFDGGGDDGGSSQHTWQDLAVDPLTGDLLGLRRDGKVFRGDLDDLSEEGGPVQGTLVADLPFNELDWGTAYWDIEVLPDGQWLALRGNGRVFRADDLLNPLVDFPGDPGDDDVDRTYMDLAPVAGGFLALRRDGQVYASEGEVLVTTLAGGGWHELVLSDVLPDLSNVPNSAPTVATYTVKVVTGESLQVPVIVTDAELPAADVLVTVDEATLPAGLVWDDVARTFTWAAAGPAGKYKVKVRADDGVAKPVTKTFTFIVKEPHAGEKNKPPLPAKITKVQALKGLAFELPLFATDTDGDALAFSVDETVYPFDAGATFDPVTHVVTWDAPTIQDVGKLAFTVLVSDGTATKKLKLKLEVVNTLLSF